MKEENDSKEAELREYLDNNPEFTKSYFIEHATTAWVDEWFGRRSHRVSTIHQPVLQPLQKSSTSSSDFVLKPLRTSYPLSKSPTSRSQLQNLYGCENNDNFSELGDDEDDNDNLPGANQTQGWCAASRSELSEHDLFMELIRDIANELDINKLSHKILVNVSLLTNGDRCSLFLVKGKSDKRYLVSRLFDVTSTSTVEESLRPEGNEIIIPIGVGIAGTTALTGEIINIKEAYEDHRFNSKVDKQTGYTTHSILCMPIKSPEGVVIGIAQVINKKSGDHQFTKRDEEVFRDYLTFCGIGITNAQLFEISVQEFKRNQALLSLARNIFETTEVVADVVKRIMQQAQELLECERCTVYLTEQQADGEEVTFGQIFDLNEKTASDENVNQGSDSTGIHQGLAAYVVKTGEAINTTDVERTAGLHDIAMKQPQKSKITSMLCTPIFNSENKIIGVAQLMNKRNGHPFTENDQGMFEAFAIFCGLGIYNTQVYEKTYELMMKQKLAVEILSYHASASKEDTDRLLAIEFEEVSRVDLTSFAFDDMPLSDDGTCLASLKMFTDLDMLSRFRISKDVLCRWILTVKKNYRPVLYHNWRHAFNVAQTMFGMFTSGKMVDWFSDLEVLVLLVACLCHDLDHRGTNNSFQAKIHSPIASLYSTSTMERHHFDHSIMILHSEGNTIFSNLSEEEYTKSIAMLEHAILSTDLALYFKKRDCFKKIYESDNGDWSKNENREILRAMMMTACDVSAITKPWPVQQRVADLVASEFFEQGDLERTQLNSEPTAMMDRKKKDELPKMQVGFIDFVCMPVYELFNKINENLKPLYNGIVDNRANWQRLADGSTKEKSHDSINTNSTDVKDDDTSLDRNESSQDRPKPKSPGVSAIKAKLSTASVKSLQKLQTSDKMDAETNHRGTRICSLM
eukprot:gene5382-6055_t